MCLVQRKAVDAAHKLAGWLNTQQALRAAWRNAL